MNKLLLLLLTGFLMLSCSTQKGLSTENDYSVGLPYIFPGEVQKLLYEKIKDVEEPVYLLLDKIDSKKYVVSLNKYNPKTFKGINWIKNTNRYAYLKEKYYPIIFEYDQLFSTPKTAKEFLDSVDSDGSYTHSTIYVMNEYAYRIEFTIRGEILHEGYDSSILQEKKE